MKMLVNRHGKINSHKIQQIILLGFVDMLTTNKYGNFQDLLENIFSTSKDKIYSLTLLLMVL